MEKNPFWQNVQGPFPTWKAPQGVKADGGGNVRGQGLVGRMLIHRAVFNRNKDEIVRLVDAGEDINEVEGAGNTPLHNAAWAGWLEGVELLLGLGAKVDASNNAGDRPWHWATNMGHAEVAELLIKNGASKQQGKVLVQEHVPKVKDFFSKPCWAHHPKPYADFVEFRKKEHAALEEERKRAVRV
ncbi:hypothetical protein MNEG_6725 [Monoraphidium neglectum]|uniref:Uncharacterized protein n=1 Tax=Monoraphidium neglectum TaxID=145388 RepID=A0A0D2ML03_9CHLO|nr:hypothetical protein MNEG_6725 [Monoraphidium neglectum]KIZ01237.1 hypothetical protein MNEG_6725 [Monoraphidium neglectum]|eukprot:XP_013900256.1 hypothetical protein MNEG_6725 [Monoraphidium neglectum]